MKKFFVTLILMLSIFSITNAHSFKSDKELNEFFSKIDQLIKEELKKDYREEMTKRKGTANNEYSFEIEDDRTVLITRSIAGIKPETEITQYFNSEGKLYMISSLTSETEKDLYALYRKYDSNGNLFIYSYAIDGKNIDRGYYSDGKLAYILELKIIKGQPPIPNGKYIEYYKNGQIKVQGNNKDGKRDGEFKAFLRNGKSAGSVFYKDGKIIKSTLVKAMKDNASFSLVTDKSYDLNLYEIITEEFKNKLLEGYLIFKKDGLFNGEKREYYEEGEIKAITPFKNSLAEGTYISYYQNGNIKVKNTYKNGNEEGEGIFYYENGKTKTLFQFNISSSTLYGWIKLKKETGDLSSRTRKRKFKVLDPEKLDEYMKNPENADKYIREIAKDFGCGKETVRVALKKLGYTRKKNRQNTGSRREKSKCIFKEIIRSKFRQRNNLY